MNGKQYFEYDYLEEFEKIDLSARFLSACMGLPIRRTTRYLVDEQTFHQHKNGGVFSANSTANMAECSSPKVRIELV